MLRGSDEKQDTAAGVQLDSPSKSQGAMQLDDRFWHKPDGAEQEVGAVRRSARVKWSD